MKDLKDIRVEIDAIDNQLLELYHQRLLLAGNVAEYKIANHRPVLDKKREDEKLGVLTSKVSDAFEQEGIRELFELIMSTSRKRQYQMMREHGVMVDHNYQPVDAFDFANAHIVYQGVEGAYSQVAMEQFFGLNRNSTHVATWKDAMDALTEKKADYAVLPIENSTAGAVTQIYDLLSSYDVSIIGEEIIRIDHALLAVPGTKISDIKRVYSHPQALMQCDRFLQNQLPGVEAQSLLNTAVSAQKVHDEGKKDQAAIAGAINARIYDLEILQSSIQDEKKNETRFLIVSGQHKFRTDAKHISICFEIPNEEGSLYRILSHFTFNGINMSRIESRPLEGRPWEYRFFVDFEGNLLDDGVTNALIGLSEETRNLRVLGNY
ncbi:MAG: prephenate dehydratase [Lachnospiraceae bacterium]|nr:prephenate dehydratase [Lachnospiraceae bacterium]